MMAWATVVEMENVYIFKEFHKIKSIWLGDDIFIVVRYMQHKIYHFLTILSIQVSGI